MNQTSANKLETPSREVGGLEKNGFAILNDVVSKTSIIQLYHALVLLVKKYDSSLSSSEFSKLQSQPSWDSELLNHKLLALRANEPKMFGLIYDTIQLSIPMAALPCEGRFASAVADAWGIDVGGIAVTGHMLRMDPPQDARNALDWHQDSSYYEQNLHGENGLVLWIPMHFVDEKNGSLVVCPGSHREGKLEYLVTRSAGENISEKRVIPAEILSKYTSLQVVADAGDALIMNMDTFHRSGVNSSERIRFIAGYRFHKMLTPDFLSGKMHFHPNEKMGRM